MNELHIGEKAVGDEHPIFVIAEAGANFSISHDPKINFQHALRLIDIAVEAKADAVKFQLYKAKKMYVANAGHANYLGREKSIYDIIQEMEVPYEWLPKLKSYCDKKRIIFLCTPFDEESADALDEVGVLAFKIASYTITHIPLLKHIAKKKKPIILSTGASDLADIHKAIDAIKETGNNQIAILQCTAKYPAPISSLNLNAIPLLRKEFNRPIGLSDHSREPSLGPMGAIAIGATVIEKHYTTDNSLPGPDHGFAILADELKDLVTNVRLMEQALGNGKKEVLDNEKELHSFARRYIYAAIDIKKGEPFSESSLAVLRCGKAEKGLAPEHYESLLGKPAAKDIRENEPIREDCV